MPPKTAPRSTGRRKRELEQRRGEVLAAAGRLFARKGFFKTGMADIAKESEFAVGSLYQFFKNKDAIYVALLEEKFEEYLATLRSRVDRENGAVEKIQALIQVQLQFFEKHRDFFRIYATEGGGADCSVKGRPGERIVQQYEAYLSLITGVMDHGIKAGIYKTLDARDLATLFSGMMKSVIHQWIISSGDEPLSLKAASVAEIFLRGVLREGGKRPGRSISA